MEHDAVHLAFVEQRGRDQRVRHVAGEHGAGAAHLVNRAANRLGALGLASGALGARREERADPFDHRPGGRHPSPEPAQFEMRVGVDESWQEGDVAEILRRDGRAAGAGADDAPARNLDPAVLDRGTVNGKKPAGSKDSG